MNLQHILVVNVHFAPNTYGGATVVAEQVAYALLRRRNMRITAVSLCQREELAPYTLLKTETKGIVNYLINVPAQRSYAQSYDNPEITARLVELLEMVDPDLVHVHCIQDMGTGIILAAEAANVRLVLSVHDFWWICERQFMQRIDQTYCGQNPVQIESCKGCAENFWAAKVRHQHLAELGARAALVTYPSKFAKTLCEASGFAVGRGVIWENGVHLPKGAFFEAQAARRKSDDLLTFGYLGGPSQIKGWPQIKQAFAGFSRDGFRVLLVDGSLDQSWWKGADFSQMPGSWEIVPRFEQSQMDEFFARIDVLLFMSQWKETYGLAIREALARGIRVIQTDSGGTVEHTGPKDKELIAIGAPVAELQDALEGAVETHPKFQSPVWVQSFEHQAAQFEELIAGLD